MREVSQTSRYRRYNVCGMAIAIVTFVSGCQSIAPPAGVISDSTRVELERSFNSSLSTINTSLAAGKGSTDAQVAQNFIESGFGLADLQCKNYFKNLGLASQQYSFARKELGLAGGAVAGLQGLTGVSAKVVSITSSMFSFGTASAETYADAFLFSPDISGVQALVETAQNAYRGAVPTTTNISYGGAANLVRGYDALCEVQTIRRLINESITSAKPVANTDRRVADAEQLITSAERYLLAKEVGEPTLSTDQVVYIYWLTFRAPSDTELPIIQRGLRGLSMFVAADGKLKVLTASELQKVKSVFASVIDRNETRLNDAVVQLRLVKEEKQAPGEGQQESTEGNGSRSVSRPITGTGISIRVR